MDDVDAWYAVMGPADVQSNLLKQGLHPTTSTPDALHALIKTDLARWAKVIADAHIKVD